MLNLTRLRILQQLGQLGSLTAVADAMRMSRPAVAQQVSRLEQEIGEPLTTRVGRHTELTTTGILIVGYANRMLAVEAEAEAAVEQLRAGVAGRLWIGAFGSAVLGLVPSVVRSFDDAHVDVGVDEMESGASLKALVSRRLDLAIVDEYSLPSDPVHESVHLEPLFEDTVFVVLPEAEAEGFDPQAGLTALADRIWILNEGSPGWHRAAMAALREHGVEPRVMHGSRGFPASLQLVAMGAGVSIQPGLALRHLPVGARAFPLHPPMRRRIMVAYRRGAGEQPLIAQALAVLRRAVTQG